MISFFLEKCLSIFYIKCCLFCTKIILCCTKIKATFLLVSMFYSLLIKRRMDVTDRPWFQCCQKMNIYHFSLYFQTWHECIKVPTTDLGTLSETLLFLRESHLGCPPTVSNLHSAMQKSSSDCTFFLARKMLTCHFGQNATDTFIHMWNQTLQKVKMMKISLHSDRSYLWLQSYFKSLSKDIKFLVNERHRPSITQNYLKQKVKRLL